MCIDVNHKYEEIYVRVVILNGYFCTEIGIFPKFVLCNQKIAFCFGVRRKFVFFFITVRCKVQYCFGTEKLFMYSEDLFNLILIKYQIVSVRMSVI